MFIGMIFNEVPGKESRQWDQVILDVLAQPPSMKCREMNPGNRELTGERNAADIPSMKCREMNPGNDALAAMERRLTPLNEVPGDESRQWLEPSSVEGLGKAPQ